MSLWTKIRRWTTKKFAGSFENMWQIAPNMSAEQFVQAYGQIGWLFACASTRANAVASQRQHIYKLDSEGNKIEDFKHPMNMLLTRPNPYLTGYKLKQLTQLYLDLLGEAFWVIERTRLGEPGELWIVNPAYMYVVPDSEKFIKAWVYKCNGKEIPVAVEDVVHLYYPDPNNPYRGIGPAQAAAVDLDSNNYANQWNRNFFYNSARPDGIIQVPRVLSEDEYNNIVKHWNESHSGVNNAHKVGLLEVGEYRQIGVSPKDMDFANLQSMTRDKILAIFGTPKSIIGITEDVNRATAETADYTFSKWTTKPLLDSLSDDINFQLVPKFKDKSIIVEFDNPIPDNKEQKIAEWTAGWNKWLTTNEIREEQGKEPLDGGDEIYIPLNMVPINSNAGFTVDAAGQKGFVVMRKVTKEVYERKKKIKNWLKDLNKEQYWYAFVNKAARQEKLITPVWVKTFKRQLQQILENLKTQKSIKSINIDSVLSFLLSKTEKQKALKDLYPVLQEIFKDKGQEFLDDFGSNISFDVNSPEVLNWINNYAAEQISQINDTTRDAIRGHIRVGEEEGESIDQIADRISEYFGLAEQWRVNTIARTETISASNAGTLEGYRQSEVVSQKEWLTAIDERTRSGHAEANGQVVGINEPFTVRSRDGTGEGEYPTNYEDLQYPGDGTTAAPDNIINCRCTILPVVD